MVVSREKELRSFYDQLIQNGGNIDFKVSAKNKKISEELRSKGHKFFSDGFFINAIDTYNEALCFAERDGLGDIYADRAECLFRMNLPEECLKSIEMAQSGPCSESYAQSLATMTVQCQERLKELAKPEPRMRLRITLPGNEKIPFMADCLKLRTSEQFGRYTITDRDLKVGDVVMAEKPAQIVLSPEMRYRRCSYCTSGEKRHALFPCATCTNALYCSEECQKTAWNDSHRFECKLSENFIEKSAKHGTAHEVQGAIEHYAMGMRCLFVGTSVYGGVREFKGYLDQYLDSDLNPFDLDYTNRDRKKETLVLTKYHFQDDFLEESRVQQVMKRMAEIVNLLIKTNTFEEEITDDLVDFLLMTLYRYTVMAIINCYGKIVSMPQQNDPQLIHVHFQLTMAMVNHSCAANVRRLQQPGEQVLVVVRPIKAGEQLFDTYVYGVTYATTSTQERQDYFWDNYAFRCSCDACKEDYPTARSLEFKKGLQMPRPLSEYIGKTKSMREVAVNYLRFLCDYMQQNDKHFPCVQLYSAFYQFYWLNTLLLGERLWEDKSKDFYQTHKKMLTYGSD